jgi:hypothetical protein
MKVLARTTKTFRDVVRKKPYQRTGITVHLRYEDRVSLAVAVPQRLPPEAHTIVAPLLSTSIEPADLVRRLNQLEVGGHAFFVTPDAEELIQRRLMAARLGKLVAEIRRAPDTHPLRAHIAWGRGSRFTCSSSSRSRRSKRTS